MTKAIASFSQVEAEVVNQMEKAGEFAGRGDAHAQKANAEHELDELDIVLVAMRANEIRLRLESFTQEEAKKHATDLTGKLVTQLVRYCAIRDINITQAFGKANIHLL